VAAVLEDGGPPWEADLAGPVIIALGGEREGLARGLAELGATREITPVTIPQTRRAQSLNVAAAGAILLAEANRQRAAREPGSAGPVA